MTVDPTASAPVDRELLADGMTWLARGIAIISLALPLAQLDSAWSQLAGVFGPLGAVAVAIGVWRVTTATASTPWAPTLRGLAVLAVPLRVATEVGVLLGEVGAGVELEGQQLDQPIAVALSAWDVVALVTIGVTFLGVIALARHLQLSLTGVAADRWKQVLYAWAVALVLVPVSVATGALELWLLSAATVITAGALLMLSLLATWRAAEDDALDEDFEQRRQQR